MDNQLQIFDSPEFGQIRTRENNNKVIFGATDIARALGYANPHDAILRHCKRVVKHEGVENAGFGAQVVQINFIPESDVYRLIFKAADQSINPEIQQRAEKFQAWIFEEVLPSIRRTGVYMTEEYRITFKEATRLANLIKTTPKYKLPMIINIFAQAGVTINGGDVIEKDDAFDVTKDFIEAYCETGSKLSVPGQAIYKAFVDYCRTIESDEISAKKFVSKMRALGYRQKTTRAHRYAWIGICLK